MVAVRAPWKRVQPSSARNFAVKFVTGTPLRKDVYTSIRLWAAWIVSAKR